MAFFSKTLDKLKGALRKTKEVLNTDVRTLFIPGRQIDDAFLIDTEEKLIRADMGVANVQKIITNKTGDDPAAVAYDACEAPKTRGIDVLIVDTAWRLHTKEHLMRELTKIRDVVAKRIEGAPHEVLLVLDATTGQNAIAQAI